MNNQRDREDRQGIRVTPDVAGVASDVESTFDRPQTIKRRQQPILERTTVKRQKTPVPQRSGNSKRQTEEAELIAGLEKMRGEDPAAFAEMMQMLARLVVSVRLKEK